MASINDLFTETFNGQNPASSTVANSRAMGASTLVCQSLVGWPTNTAVHFATYQKDATGAKIAGTQTDWKGVVSGSSINTLTRRGGAADSGNGIGDIVEMMPTYSWAQDLAGGLELQHLTTGAHQNITTNTIATTGNASIGGTLTTTGGLATNNTVSAANLATNAITLGYAQITAGNFTTPNTSDTAITGLSTTITVPAGGRSVRVSVYLSQFLKSGAAGDTLTLKIYMDGAQVQEADINIAGSNFSNGGVVCHYVNQALGTGSHTFAAYTAQGTAGTITVQGAAQKISYILVEAL